MNETQPNPAPVPVNVRGTEKTIFVYLAIITMVTYFIVLSALGIWYMAPLAFGACIITMCYFSIIVIFFCGGYKMFIAPIKEFHAGVLVNQSFGPKAPKNDQESLGFAPTKYLEEVGSGVNPKLPWQKIICINLQRHIPIGKEASAYSKNQVEHNYTWFGTVRAVRGFCCVLVRIGAPAAISILEKFTDAAMAQMINHHTYQQISKNQTILGEDLRKLFGGDGNMSVKEQSCALAVEGLGISKIVRSKGLQESAELPEKAKNLARAMKALMEARSHEGDTSLTGLKAIDRILAEGDKADLQVFEGLEGSRPLVEVQSRKNRK